MDAGFTFITIGWTPANGSVVTEVHEHHNLSEQPHKGVQHCVKNLIEKREYTAREN